MPVSTATVPDHEFRGLGQTVPGAVRIVSTSQGSRSATLIRGSAPWEIRSSNDIAMVGRTARNVLGAKMSCCHVDDGGIVHTGLFAGQLISLPGRCKMDNAFEMTWRGQCRSWRQTHGGSCGHRQTTTGKRTLDWRIRARCGANRQQPYRLEEKDCPSLRLSVRCGGPFARQEKDKSCGFARLKNKQFLLFGVENLPTIREI